MKYTKRILITTVIILCGCLSIANADDSTPILGNIGIGNKTMDVKIRDRTFDAQFTMLNMALSASFGAVYTSLGLERSIQDDVRTDGAGLLFYSREDTSLTAGYNIGSSMTLFAGVIQSLTTTFYNNPNSQGDIKSFGAFAGGGFNHRLGSGSVLGLSIAVAKLSGEVTLNEPFVDRSIFPPAIDAPQNIDGSAVGLSYVASWTASITKSTSYNVLVKLHRYTFDDQVVFGGIDLSYNENVSTLAIGLRHIF